MRKYIMIFFSVCIVVLGSAVVFAFSASEFTAKEVDFKVIINGEEYEFTQPVVTIADSTYLPVREFCNIIGYDINWNEKERTVSMSKKNVTLDDANLSREGILSNGRKYIFYGVDSQNFSISDYIENKELFPSVIYDDKIQEQTIEAIAEEVQILFGLNGSPAEIADILIYYDAETEELLFMKDYHGVPQPGGTNVIVVNCCDGSTTMYSSKTA
mgnify:CR=1 FL=1